MNERELVEIVSSLSIEEKKILCTLAKLLICDPKGTRRIIKKYNLHDLKLLIG